MENTALANGLEKPSFDFNNKKSSSKESLNTNQLHLAIEKISEIIYIYMGNFPSPLVYSWSHLDTNHPPRESNSIYH